MRPAELFYFIQLSNVRVNEKVFFLIFYSALLYKMISSTRKFSRNHQENDANASIIVEIR